MNSSLFTRCTNRAKWKITTSVRSIDYSCDKHLAQLAIGPHVLFHGPAGPGEAELQCDACVFPDEQISDLPQDNGVAPASSEQAPSAATL